MRTLRLAGRLRAVLLGVLVFLAVPAQGLELPLVDADADADAGTTPGNGSTSVQASASVSTSASSGSTDEAPGEGDAANNGTEASSNGWLLPGDATCTLTGTGVAAAITCSTLDHAATADATAQALFPSLSYYGTWTVGIGAASTTLDIITISSWAGAPGDEKGQTCSAACARLQGTVATLQGAPEHGLMATLVTALRGEPVQADAASALSLHLEGALALETLTGERASAYYDASAATLHLPTPAGWLHVDVAWQAAGPTTMTPEAWAAVAFDGLTCLPDDALLHAALAGALTAAPCGEAEGWPLHLDVRLAATPGLGLSVAGALGDAQTSAGGVVYGPPPPAENGREPSTTSEASSSGETRASTDDQDANADETADEPSGLGGFLKRLFRGLFG